MEHHKVMNIPQFGHDVIAATACPSCGRYTLTMEMHVSDRGEDEAWVTCSSCTGQARLVLNDLKHNYLCEVCGKKLTATPAEAFSAGWDTPPHFTTHVTCDSCPISGTMWYMLMLEQQRREQNNR